MAVKRQLNQLELTPRRVTEWCFCRCEEHCFRWAGHPLGCRMQGDDFNQHLLDEAKRVEVFRHGPMPQEPWKVAAAEIEERMGLPGRYLVAVGQPCSAGGRCYIEPAAMLRRTKREWDEWEGWCDAHEDARDECWVAGEEGVRPFRK